MIDPLLQSKFTEAERLYNDAKRAFTPLLEQMACAELLQHYPDAVVLGVVSTDAFLRVSYIALVDGQVLEEGFDSFAEPWEAMTENVEPLLDWLRDLTGDEFEGDHEIDVLRVLGVSA